MKQFFGTNGLTSAEANHLANVAFELVQSKEQELERVSVNEIDVHIDGTNLRSRNLEFDTSKIIENLKWRPRLYQVSAWLREAVKEKENELNKLNHEYPELKDLDISPPVLTSVDENWAKDQLSVKELADFLACEAEAAAIGKYIHNNGLIKQWQNDIKCDLVFKDRGGHLYNITRQANREDVNKIFFDMQKNHRNAEKKVNFYKAKLKDMVNKENQSRIDAYQKEMRSYEQAVRQTDEYNNKVKEEWEREKIKRREQISSMKIVVPNELQETVNYIKSFAE